ncbi:class I SAM-dependent methyltransferase [Streptomyces colonosanans]|uniref:Methyltransferase n=1 Tax=Streptomyces colonosanans TaxID=1428652 RepID=A0A1S2PDE0_9ACTN|nr:class I SAM-dependent methyltransferase [Streptomyces colonosanans]OIJ91680.1 methyltransferase [Streptomyces colonosanans]
MSYQPDELFTSTAPYYAKYRAGYPPQLFTHLADWLGLDCTQNALDLGTGTGAIAIPLSEHVREITAVDPDPGMLNEGRKLASARGITNIAWRLGDSHHLDQLNLGPLHLVTLGQAFHWTERDVLLSALDNLITPDGAVVVVGGPTPGAIEPPAWLQVVDEVRSRYLGRERRAGSGTYAHPKEGHQEVLARSPFSHIEVARWDRVITRDLDQVVGLQFSYSYSSPAQFGDKKAAFEEDLRRALTEFSPEGGFDELVRTEAIIATRPQ